MNMGHYVVYTGTREGFFSVNSRALPGQKLRVRAELPFKVEDDDLWIASMRDMVVLSTVNFVPTTIRQAHGDPTYCSPWEGAFLEGLAANCPEPARVVEIGTGKGSSLVRIMYGLALHEDARVWSIDLLEQEETREALEAAQVPNWRYDMLVGDSAEMGQAEWEPLDLVFVDGSHSYEGVKADVEAWASHLKTDGVMAFHDYGNDLHRVTEAVDEMMGDGWLHVGLVGTLTAYQKQD
jgi:protein-L-isoaspartate O-methyltransferase